MTESLSRQLARFVVGLTYESIPSQVVDKVKACTLHNLASALLGALTPRGQAGLRFVKEEEGRPDGATLLVDGGRATRMGAVFANSELMHVTNQCDSYRMLTHPGPCVVPAALATTELLDKGGEEFITALVAGYEVETRIARDFIPSTQARGFRSAPVYGIFGAAVATGKLLDLTEDQMVNAIALAATSASGTAETARTGSHETFIHEPNAARNGVLAALLAREEFRCAETSLEGEAGFYHAFTGSNEGRLSYVFTGPKRAELSNVVEGIATRYEMLNVTFKPYPTPGYNNPVIDLMADLTKQHNIDSDGVEGITVELNWLETTYPSPAFPRQELSEPRVGTIYYATAYTCVEGNYPLYGQWYEPRLGRGGERGDGSKVFQLMKRVRVTGSQERDFFSPKITVNMKDGTTYEGEFTGQEFKWGFEEDSRRLRDLVPGLPITPERFEQIVRTVGRLQDLSSINELVRLTVPG